MGTEAEVGPVDEQDVQDSSLDVTSSKPSDDTALEKRKSRLRGRGKKPSPKEMESPDEKNE